MTATRITRTEACAELARRLGWTNITLMPPLLDWLPNEKPQYVGIPAELVTLSDGTQVKQGNLRPIPDYLTSRDAAADLVQWIKTQPEDLRFTVALLGILNPADDAPDTLCWAFLLATPEQITLAACAALGLEVE